MIDFASDAEGRLASTARVATDVSAAYSYDGRSFLTRAVEATGDPPTEAASVESVYDSSGLVHALRRQASPTDPEELVVFFYLAGRPVGQVAIDGGGGETWRYFTTDHLGTPLLATDDTGALAWEGGFRPFGGDYQEETPAGALESGVYLRLPGQWEDASWQEASSGAAVYYNVHRWYQPGVGSYSRGDPINLGRLLNLTPLTGLPPFTEYQQANLRIGNPKLEAVYGYAAANPLGLTDPDGQVAPLI